MVTEVSKLKRELDGEIVVYASYQLGRTLIEHDLVDELRLVVFPVVLGAGERLFGDTSDHEAHAPRSTPRPSVTGSPSSPTRWSGRPSGIGQRRRPNKLRLGGSPCAAFRPKLSSSDNTGLRLWG